MEEGIYRMSLGENFLVLIIIGLWLFAVINLARKLERICNPPSTYPNYSIHNKTSSTPSTYHEHYARDLIPPPRASSNLLVRATSEPTIDASPRATILVRSPSETFLQMISSKSGHIASPSTLELRSDSSLTLPSQSDYQIQIESLTTKPVRPQQLLNPRRIPSIVRRSLLDLHRRALMANTSTQYIVTTTENRSMATMNRFPLMKKKYQRHNTIDEDIC